MLDFTHQLIDDSVVISLIGSLLNEMSKKAVLDMVQTYLEQGKLLFIINCGQLSAINSMGLTLLLNILTKVRNEDGEVILTNIPLPLKKVLIITKLNEIFDLQENIENALAKYSLPINN